MSRREGSGARDFADRRALQAELQRGFALHQQNRLAEAERIYRAILDRAPQNFDALHLLGVLAHQCGAHDEAVRLLTKAVSVNPASAPAHVNRASALQALNRRDEALAAYDSALQISPDAVTFYLRGNLLAEGAQFEDAAASFAKAIALKPDFSEAHSNHANCMISLERAEDALRSFDKALALKPDADDYYNRGIALEKLGRYEEAITSYDKAIAAKPRFAEAYASRGKALKEAGEFAKALDSLDAAIAIDPNSAEAHHNRGAVLRAQEDLHGARRSFERSILLRPDFVEAYKNLGLVLSSLKDFAAAEQVAARAVNVVRRQGGEPGKIADLELMLGNALRNLNRAQDARLAYERALDLRPDSVEALIDLGSLFQELGDIDAAQTLYSRALALDPRNARAYYSLADARKFSKDDSMIETMEQLSNSTLSSKDRLFLDFALGKAYSDVKDYERAFTHFVSGAAAKRATLQYDDAVNTDQFSRIESVFTHALLANSGSGEASARPIFIVGMPRSGTTLVEQILASHPLVHGAGELHCLDKAIADVLREERISEDYPQFMHTIGARGLKKIGGKYLELISELSSCEALYITDKMPANFFYVGLIHLALPNAKIIHTRRDPVDTCISCFSKLFSEGQHFTYDLGELGRYYKRYEKLMAHWRNALPASRILDVDYESVVADLEIEARRILSFCGLPWDERCLSFHKTERRVKTASVTQVRQPIYATSVGRRRHYAEFLAPLLDALGESVAGT